VPVDDREAEVLYAGLVAVGVLSEVGVQVRGCRILYTV
jgi:hypothetical protein